MLVSFGYRFILPGDLLARFPDRAVNLHIAYLPWNRGAHPNVWSAYEGTPAGEPAMFEHSHTMMPPLVWRSPRWMCAWVIAPPFRSL